MRYQQTKHLLPLITSAGLLGGMAFAGTVTIDFNSDPSKLNLYNTDANLVNNAQWRANYGASGKVGDGYMSITDAIGSQSSELVFNDLENGLIVAAFTFDMDVRIGGHSGGNPPADGFSVNYCSADDPVVVNAAASTLGGWSGTDGEPGTDTTPGAGGLPEEGTSTGIGIGFDEWQSGTIRGAQDVVGISLRVEGNLILQWPVPLSSGNIYYSTDPEPQNLVAAGQSTTTPYVYYYDPNHTGNPYNDLAQTDPNYIHSLQTGPRNPNAASDPTSYDPQSSDPTVQATWTWYLLSWEHFHVGVDASGVLTLSYKGQTITPTNGLQTSFAPRQGRIVFGGRTGGANDNRHIDNIVLNTVGAQLAVVGAASGYAAGFTVQVSDSGPSQFDPTSMHVFLNGTEVTTAGSASKTNGVTTFAETLIPANFLPGGSTNTVTVNGTDTLGHAITGSRTFVVAPYVAVPPSYATATPATGSGFNLAFTYMADVWQRNRNAYDTGGDNNSVVNAENQIVGGLWNPRTGAPVTNLVNQSEAPGNQSSAAYINFEYTGSDPGGDHFNSTSPADNPVPNNVFPGIDVGVDPSEGAGAADNFTMVATSFLHLKPGYYRMAVNSDDGFDVKVAPGLGDQFGLLLGQYNGGRGASDTYFDFTVSVEGDYPTRLAYWQGSGGANCEFYSYDIATGTRTLINNPDPSSAYPGLVISAHSSGHGKAAITSLSPYPGFQGVELKQPIVATLVDDATTVNQGSIAVTLDGASVTPNVSHSGTTTTVTVPAPAGGWTVLSTHSGALVWSDSGGTTRTNAFNFTVRTLTPFDLPSNSFWIEAEDFNHNSGKAQAAANTMPYLGGAYDQLSDGVFGVDYSDSNSQAGTTGTGTIARLEDNAADNEFAPTTDNTGGRWGSDRPGHVTMTYDFRIGWIGGGQWFNYTRSVPPGLYNVYTAQSYGGTGGAGQIAGTLYTVTSDPSKPNQTLQQLGSFSATGTANWGDNGIVEMQAFDGSPAVAKITGSSTTFQMQPTSGDFDYFVLAPVTSPPKVVAASPARGAYVPRNTTVNFSIQDLSTTVATSGVKLAFDGADVTAQATITKTGDTTTVSWTPSPTALPAINQSHTATLTYTDSANATFTYPITYITSPFGTPGQFLIEAEDFDSNGTSPAATSAMPYTGLAQQNATATYGVDYSSDNGNDSNSYGRVYSKGNVDSNENGDFNRGLWTQKENYKLGWTDTNNWDNYTRTIPAGTYSVYVGLSHGDAAGTANDCRAALGLVTAGAGTTNQTVQTLGWFRGPATGGWGNNRLLPLLDSGAVNSNNAPLGNPITVSLGGATAQTLRMNQDSGDYDYFVLIPAASAPTVSIGWDNGGNVQVIFTGTLQSSSSISGPFTPVAGATSPYKPSSTTGNVFYRSAE